MAKQDCPYCKPPYGKWSPATPENSIWRIIPYSIQNDGTAYYALELRKVNIVDQSPPYILDITYCPKCGRKLSND